VHYSPKDAYIFLFL